MVHHNTVSLDKLVEMAWVEILTKYAVDEECDFLVSFTPYVMLAYLMFGSYHDFTIFHLLSYTLYQKKRLSAIEMVLRFS